MDRQTPQRPPNTQQPPTRRRNATLRRVILFGLALLAGYVLIRPWLNNWGAAKPELTRTLPGDDLIPDPNYQTTRAVTIDAPPGDVWPWLVQLGAGRGGLYSYDRLDILFGVLDRPSANELVPAYQTLAVGEAIPLGAGGDLIVDALESERALVTVPEALPEGTLTWAFVLETLTGNRTRLLTRNRAHLDWSLRWLLTMAVIELPAFLMTRKMLLGIKRRVEREGERTGKHAREADRPRASESVG
jgi:hypothetical protein